MTDFKVNEDDLREPDIPDLGEIAERISERMNERLFDEMVGMFDTMVTVQSNQPPITYESLAETFEMLKTEKARIDAAETIRIVQALEQLTREHTKMKDFSFADGDWLILPAETFDSIDAPLPKGVMRSIDETSSDIFAVRGRDFKFPPDPGALLTENTRMINEARNNELMISRNINPKKRGEQR